MELILHLVTLVLGIIFIVIFEFFFRNIRHRMDERYELEKCRYFAQIKVMNKLFNKKSNL